MRRNISFVYVFILAALAAVFTSAAPAQERKSGRPVDMPFSSAEQLDLWGGKIALRRAEIATNVIRSFGGPFRDAYFFSSKGELLNKTNTLLSEDMVRRDGLRIPLGRVRYSTGAPAFSLSVEIDRWPCHDALRPYRSNMRYGNRGLAVGVEIDLGKLFAKGKRDTP